jgi:hypothetical protein
MPTAAGAAIYASNNYDLLASTHSAGLGLVFCGFVLFLASSAILRFGKEPVPNTYQWGRWQAMKVGRWVFLVLGFVGLVELLFH